MGRLHRRTGETCKDAQLAGGREPLKSTVNGDVAVKGRNSGFFVMSKQF